jgi:hypothetical protein
VNLELEVGAKLLERRARGIALTAAGRVFLDHARLALLQVEAAGEAARRAEQPEKPHASGADLLWRVKTNLRLPCEKRLSDGSYLSTIYRSGKDRRQGTNGIRVRVIEYTLEGVA